MSHTLTIRLDRTLADWLEREAARTGVPQGRIIRNELERARKARGARPFMRLAGTVDRAKDLSARKGFSRG
ncbi:MAG: hypothetical protein K2Y23_00715 [Cyanobacteria bacterium]|nr:hypothetical protein [Cyanobacteriota bacterium]